MIGILSRQPLDQLPSLGPTQLLDRLDYPIQLALAHHNPRPGLSGTSPCSQFEGQVAHSVSLSLLNAN
ncbi:MAG TPA: hypothetical protein VIY30_04015 [Burkholderiaceae bacterium]